MPLYDFDPPLRFVVGTVGQPGQRTFFLQARDERRLVSVSCEKEQLAVLADRMLDLLDEFAGEPGSDAAAAAYADDGPLENPIEEEFRVTTIALGWDPERRAFVLEATHERDEEEGPPLGGLGSVRVVLPPAQARAFARRTRTVIASGRPPCPFCGGPLDPTGHICPRANGYRR